jgi:sigma-B regulation protein RsbU (phosphoserine phosphatase)
MRTQRFWLIAFAVALSAFALARVLESALIRVTRRDPWELAYVSDTVLSLLVMAATYLWLHVRSLRGQLSSLERDRIAADAELALAARIQRTALDSVAQPTAGLLWFAETRPAGVVGGDFYDLIALDDGAMLILVADVSGKGVPAAIGLAAARATFRMMAQSLGDPGEIARRWSRWLYADTLGAPYLTALLVRLEPDRQRLSYVNAGHPAGLLVWPGGERRLTATCPPLGLVPALAASAESLDLPRDALCVLITDGGSEAFENGGDPIVQVAALARACLTRTPRDIAQALLEAAGSSRHGRISPPDDLTAMAFKIEP